MQIVRGDAYGWAALADLFNRTRAGYIVPMSLTADGLRAYAAAYDLSLEHAFAAVDSAGELVGMGMLGLRPGRAWVTRLGVLPERRGQGIAGALLAALLADARAEGAGLVQLEYILGNDGAGRLFSSAGFEETRELVIVERTAAPLDVPSALEPIPRDDIPAVLATRRDDPSWVSETASLLQWGPLDGFRVRTDAGESWIVFQRGESLLAHVALGPFVDAATARAVLEAMHSAAPAHDAQVENVPADSPYLPVLDALGYRTAFRRREMTLEYPPNLT